MTAVLFENVEKRFDGGVTALKSLTLEAPEQKFVALLGPSGCGKTTALRILAGLEMPTSGRVLIGGRDVTRLQPRDRDLAMVFQSYALYPHLSVKENMAFALRLQRHPETESRVAEAAEMLGLTPLLARLPKELSGGQRQRVAMGRAIVRRPSVFLFDEPLSNLDAALRQQMRVELRRRHQLLRTTTLYVTHDQVEALTLADRIVVLNAGVVQQVGTPDELYFDPANRFVAGFIGSPTMNFVEHVPGCVRGEVVGVRPNDVEVGSGEIVATVEFVERLGFEAMVHLRVGEETLMARVEGEAPSPGAKVGVRFSRSYRFEKATGARVREPA